MADSAFSSGLADPCCISRSAMRHRIVEKVC